MDEIKKQETKQSCSDIVDKVNVICGNDGGMSFKTGITFLFMACGLGYPIVSEEIDNDILYFMKKGYLHNGKVTAEGWKLMELKEQVRNNVINSTLPILTDETANITKRLAKHFLGDMFKGTDYKQYNEVCGNAIMAPFFFMFMNMFPSSNLDKNKHWNTHFTVWTNVNLRRITGMTVKNFKKVYKTKDMGLFLLGTYMFIKESHNQEKNQYFVKNLENYWREYEYWYNRAEEMLNNGQLADFTRPQKVVDTNNIIMI
jgi:hypothetical protein